MNSKSIFDIINACKSIASAGSSIDSIVGSLTGSSGTPAVVSAINRLDADIKQGFLNVVDAINDQTLIQEWTPIGTSLTTMVNQCLGYLGILSSITLAGSGTYQGQYIVIVNDEQTLFATWATSATGPLTTLATYVQPPAYGGPPGQLSLVGMFTSTETSSSALRLWQEIAAAAQGNDNVVLDAYQNQTIFHLTFAFMQEIFCTVGMIYYINDGILKLINQINPSNGFISISGYVNKYFGDASTSGQSSETVWGLFANNLNNLQTTPLVANPAVGQCAVDPNGQSSGNRVAFTGDNYVGPDSYADRGIAYFVNLQITAGENAYFGSLQLANIPAPNNGLSQMTVFALQGTSVTVGADLVLTPGDWAQPAIYTYQQGWQLYQITPANNVWVYADNLCFSVPDSDDHLYANYSYALPPVPSSVNATVVVTGAQLTTVGNRLALAIQFGELDVSDVSSPVVKPLNGGAFVQPVWAPGYYTQEFFDERPAGPYKLNASGQPVLVPDFISNVSLVALGNRNGLNVQMAHTLYSADFFQPDKLPAINP